MRETEREMILLRDINTYAPARATRTDTGRTGQRGGVTRHTTHGHSTARPAYTIQTARTAQARLTSERLTHSTSGTHSIPYGARYSPPANDTGSAAGSGAGTPSRAPRRASRCAAAGAAVCRCIARGPQAAEAPPAAALAATKAPPPARGAIGSSRSDRIGSSSGFNPLRTIRPNWTGRGTSPQGSRAEYSQSRETAPGAPRAQRSASNEHARRREHPRADGTPPHARLNLRQPLSISVNLRPISINC